MTENTQFLAGVQIPDCAQAEQLTREHTDAPQNFQINLKLGIFYLAQADYAKSIQYLLAAHNAKPTVAVCSRDLALAYLAAGRFADAVSLLHDAALNHPLDSSLRLLLADAYRGEGDMTAAKSELLWVAQSGKSIHDFFMAGAGLLELGSPNDALKAFERGTALYPNSAKLFMGMGIAQNIQHRNADARSSFMRAIDLSPSYAPPYGFLAQMASGTEANYQKIMQRITAFLVTHPENATAHYDYALALWEHSRENIAAQQLNEIAAELHLAIGLNPKDSDFYFLLGVISAEGHQLTQAAANFRECLALDPTNAEAHYRLSLIYRRLNQPQLASKELKEFLQLRNEQKLSSSARNALGAAHETIAIAAGSVRGCKQSGSS